LGLALKQNTTESERPLTERTMLSRLASVFDPMGLFSPVVLAGKTLLQEMWAKKFDWDDLIEDHTIKDVWNGLLLELQDIPKYKVPRYFGYDEEEDKVFSIVCFCDASKKAYATTVYLHQESNSCSKANIVFAKIRLAPVKHITIPRLELMAIVIDVRCIQYVKEQLQMDITNTYLWSDSQVALAWINSDKKLPVFVRNRISDIKKQSDIVLNYVNTEENPADVAKKGATVNYLSNLWWHGQNWLDKPSSEWKIGLPQTNCLFAETDEDNEGSSPIASAAEQDRTRDKQDQHAPLGIDCEIISSLTKLFRVTALALRFIRRLIRQRVNSYVTGSDMKEVENLWIVSIQKKVFQTEIDDMSRGKLSNLKKQLGIYADSDGLIRCRGRLDKSGLSEGAKRPILLPKGEKFTWLVIEKTHKENLHSGVSQTLAGIRRKYWIPQGRSLVKSVLQRCSVCRRYEGGPYRTPPLAALPASRVRGSCPFSRSGVDFFGPLLVKSQEGAQKVWICLFSCMVTRAVHLELIQDMTTEEFLLAFERFISQRGTPCEVISDNAAHFKLAGKTLNTLWEHVKKSDDVQSYVSSSGINWHFIVELAPWMGGFYERLVGIVKRSLRKSMGRKLLTLIQLQTLIKEVEAVVNSRPLVYVSDDINSTVSLTPSHFLTPIPQVGTPEADIDSDPAYNPGETSLVSDVEKGTKNIGRVLAYLERAIFD